MRMLKNRLNLETTRGDTLSFGVRICDLGQAVETAYFTVKKNYDDETFLFQKSLGDGISLDSVSEGDYFYKVRVAPEDTEDLETGQYYYDFQIAVNGDVFTVLKGVISIDFDVTR